MGYHYVSIPIGTIQRKDEDISDLLQPVSIPIGTIQRFMAYHKGRRPYNSFNSNRYNSETN